MKRKLLYALCFGIAIAACRKESSDVKPLTSKTVAGARSGNKFVDTSSVTGSQFISMTDANTMINSYLSSINSPQNDTDVRSFSINADSLRAYLADPTVKNVKLMLGHTMAYINAGNAGQYAGYQSGAITIIIAGYDSLGNYIYHGGSVLDHAAPCPYTCVNGPAGNYLLQ